MVTYQFIQDLEVTVIYYLFLIALNNVLVTLISWKIKLASFR